MSSQPNQASRTPNFSHLFIFSTSFSSSFPSLSFLFTTLPSSQNTKLSHPSPSLHAMIMSWHCVQHTPSASSTQDCLSSLHSHDYTLILECSCSFWRGFPTRSTAISQLALRAERKSHLATFPHLRINNVMNRFSPPGVPSIDHLEVLFQSCSVTSFKVYH